MYCLVAFEYSKDLRFLAFRHKHARIVFTVNEHELLTGKNHCIDMTLNVSVAYILGLYYRLSLAFFSTQCFIES